ncbi:hypothetical protein LJC31_00440 [Synergistaceae bacterium OttesenSCG-928-I11]|nr:hypothetical protein [Synergistaceae bacterium OttesenSCG-928-I11]
MTAIPISREDAMPRMRAYLTRAGYASHVSDVSKDVMRMARDVYLEAFDRAEPVAISCDREAKKFPGAVSEALAGCASYTLLFFSLGACFDAAVDDLLARGETLRAMLMDAWGSEAVEALAEHVDATLRKERGAGTMRFSPGYEPCDIRENFAWFEAIAGDCGHDDGTINFSEYSVNPETGIITPRKSVICAIGWRDA